MGKRGKKFAAKLSGDNRKRLYDLQKDRMARLEADATKELVNREEQIKRLIQGEPVYFQHFYMAFAKEIYSKEKRFKAQTLLNEIVILQNKWISRGLNPILLEEIKNLYVQPYAYIRPFRLDISLLDGPHILS